jgi:hypothetical protein
VGFEWRVSPAGAAPGEGDLTLRGGDGGDGVVFWEHLCTQAFFLLPVMFLSYIFLVSLPFPFRFFVALDTHIDRPRGKRAGWSTVFTKTYFVYYLLFVVSWFIFC